MHADHPELVKDQFWDDIIPDELPYTIASEQSRMNPWEGSTAEVKDEKYIVILINPIKLGQVQPPKQGCMNVGSIREGLKKIMKFSSIRGGLVFKDEVEIQ